MDERAKFYVCGRIVITKGESVLMGKELGTEDTTWFMWETPGGGLQPGETLEECLKREALEEIGVDIRVLSETPRFRSTTEIHQSRYDPDAYWLMVYCRCEPLGEPSLSQATDREFVELLFVSQKDFERLVAEGRVSHADRRHLPGLMVDLGLWDSK
jgi:8-oxo-dGTP pyrophosphatase MutT (NUDIX family)